MSGSLVADLGIGPRVWLFLALLAVVTMFFKVGRLWSVRNLDLLLLFAPAPGLMQLVGSGDDAPWYPFQWLFLGSGVWLIRCLADLGLSRRPILEPNLSASGLACLAAGVLGLLLAETVNLPVEGNAHRNPAEPRARPGQGETPGPPGADALNPAVKSVLKAAPLPSALKREPIQVVLSRVLASLAHLSMVGGLLYVGWRHFERPMAGLSAATSYLLLPYTRIALVDSGQLIPAALILGAVVAYKRPWTSGALLGLSAGWMPACLGLIPLWVGFYRGRGAWRFAGSSVSVVLACGLLALAWPDLAIWARALGGRSLAEVGLLPWVQAPSSPSFWMGIDPSFRLPVVVGYGALVVVTTFWPAEKNLGTLIALSAALLVAGQFWYLEQGGTLILLYLPLILLMIFRPNLATKRPEPSARRERLAAANGVPH